MPANFSAVVLAGGRSTRMGRDKALLEVDGEPLWRRQRNLLIAAGAIEIFLSARPGQSWAREAGGFTTLVYDALAHGGPLVGITAGLERSSQPWLAVLAVDMPEMTAAWFRGLLAACRPGVGVVARNQGHLEPLAAIYPREFIPLAWAALARGNYALQPLLAQAVAEGVMLEHPCAEADRGLFRNWNAPTTKP